MSLQDSDREAAAVAVAPRVALADIEAAIAHRFDLSGEKAAVAATGAPSIGNLSIGFDHVLALGCLSICIIVLHNGFTVIGKSAPAAVENFDAELGRKFAYEDAIRQLWPLMGFELRARLHRAASARESPA